MADAANVMTLSRGLLVTISKIEKEKKGYGYSRHECAHHTAKPLQNTIWPTQQQPS
jgi:hypothetical protein